MPISTLIATPGDPQANSYISTTEADQYFVDRYLSTSWTGASADLKKQALMEATRLIDAYSFHSAPLFEWQQERKGLQWPRYVNERISLSVSAATSTTIQNDSLMKQRQYPAKYWKYGGIWFTDTNDSLYGQFFLVSDFNFSTGTITIDGTFSTVPTIGDAFEIIQEIPPEIKWATCETAIAIIDSLLVSQNNSNIKNQSLEGESVTYFDKSTQTIELPNKAYQLIKPYIRTTGSTINTPLFR